MRDTTSGQGPAGAVRVARIVGVDVFLRLGVLVMGAVVVAVLAPRLDDQGTDRPVLLAAVVVVALYASILVHELAHVLVARAYRMEVESVTLHLLGGETLIVGPSRSPLQEGLTAVSGPLASLAIGGAALLARDSFDGDTTNILWSVGWINVVLAAVNLVPGLPLDGGRVLRAVVWGITGSEHTGIVAAGWFGRVTAVATMALGVWLVRSDSVTGWLDLTVCGIVAMFLWQGSSQALRYAGRADRIGRLSARRLAVDHAGDGGHEPDSLPPLDADLSGVDLLRAVARDPADVYVLVEHDGSTVGYLHTAALDAAYREGTA